MRNLLVYPVTLDEIVECLERCRDDARAEERCGDMRPMLLNLAISAVRYRELKLWERGDREGMRAALAPPPIDTNEAEGGK
jgi:hypothetical protein